MLLCCALLAACGSAKPASSQFSIDVGERQLEVARGGTVSLTVRRLAEEGFADEVTVRAAPTPETRHAAGALAIPDRVIPASADSTELSLAVEPGLPTGTEFVVEVVALSTHHREVIQVHVRVKDTGGAPDPGFGSGGRASSVMTGSNDGICGMAPATAQLSVLAGVEADEYVLRAFDGAGAAAAGFGAQGVVRTGITTVSPYVPCPLLRDERGGYLLVGQRVGNAQAPAKLLITRYTATGALDTTYGTEGIAQLDGHTSRDILATAVVYPDGGVLVLTWSDVTVDSLSESALGLLRVDGQGKPAAGFGTAGRAVHVAPKAIFNADVDTGVEAAPSSDGRLLIAYTARESGDRTDLVLARFTERGGLDDTFAEGAGRAVFPLGSEYPLRRSALVQPDGKMLLSARGIRTGPFILLRVSAAGMPDASFGVQGRVGPLLDAPVGDGNASIVDLGLDATGRTIAALDYSSQANGGEASLARLMPDGSFDGSFGVGGIYTVLSGLHGLNFVGAGKLVGMSVLADGRIVTAGQQPTPGSGYAYFITRSLP